MTPTGAALLRGRTANGLGRRAVSTPRPPQSSSFFYLGSLDFLFFVVIGFKR